MKVFEPATIGSITLSNHFIRSATAEGLANRQGFCSMPMSAFMVKLAKGGAGLIITGSHGISGFEEYWIGSNAFKIVTYATCPVVTVPPPGEAPVVGRNEERAAVQAR